MQLGSTLSDGVVIRAVSACCSAEQISVFKLLCKFGNGRRQAVKSQKETGHFGPGKLNTDVEYIMAEGHLRATPEPGRGWPRRVGTPQTKDWAGSDAAASSTTRAFSDASLLPTRTPGKWSSRPWPPGGDGDGDDNDASAPSANPSASPASLAASAASLPPSATQRYREHVLSMERLGAAIDHSIDDSIGDAIGDSIGEGAASASARQEAQLRRSSTREVARRALAEARSRSRLSPVPSPVRPARPPLHSPPRGIPSPSSGLVPSSSSGRLAATRAAHMDSLRLYTHAAVTTALGTVYADGSGADGSGAGGGEGGGDDDDIESEPAHLQW